jgi:hypothetical protein
MRVIWRFPQLCSCFDAKVVPRGASADEGDSSSAKRPSHALVVKIPCARLASGRGKARRHDHVISRRRLIQAARYRS